jgi:phosphatidylserine synthase
MTTISDPSDEHDRRLTRALENPPQIVIPNGFAQRVAAAAPARMPALPAKPHRVGIRVAWVTAAILLLAVYAIAQTAAHWIQLTFEIEFIVLIAWLSLRLSLSSD